MKKLLIFLYIAASAVFRCFAQSDMTQVVMPKTIYVGDTAELRCTFRSAVDFFSDMNDAVLYREITLQLLPIKTHTDD